MSFEYLENNTLKNGNQLIFLRHRETGLEIAYANQKTKNESFSFNFKTPVINPFLGTSHAVEHCVFGGSRKFPVDLMLLKKYLVYSEFNGYTSDWLTTYSFRTNNPDDFNRMLPVIADAVFFPLLSEYTFMKDVFRFERDRDGIFLTGALYNEVKCNELRDEKSGGSPYKLPELSLQKVRNYHKKYYRPDNCLFCYDGNMPLENLLNFLETTFLHDLCNSFENPKPSSTCLLKNYKTEVYKDDKFFHNWFLNEHPKSIIEALSWYWTFGFSPLTPFCCEEKYKIAINTECYWLSQTKEKKEPDFNSDEVIIQEYFTKHKKRTYMIKLFDFHKWCKENQNATINNLLGPFSDFSEKDIDWNEINKKIEQRELGVEIPEVCKTSLKILLSKDNKKYFSDFALCFYLANYLDDKVRKSGYAYAANLRVYPQMNEINLINAPDVKKAWEYVFDSIDSLEHFTTDDIKITHIAAFNYLNGNDYHPRIYSESFGCVFFSPEFFSVTPQDMEDALERLKNYISSIS